MRFNCFNSSKTNEEHRADNYKVNTENTVQVNGSRESFRIEPLYVILPYFNYCNYKNRIKLFLEFIKRIYNNRRIKIIIVEGAHKENSFDLPNFSDKIFLHIRVVLKDRIWVKENLINLAIRNLPKDWHYVAWIDADLTFTNDNWVTDTIQKLKTYDVLQLFTTALNLGPNGDVIKYDKGFAYQYLESKQEYTKTYKYGFWHPGYAWACNRKAYTQMGGLIDFGILGSGDHHMALAFINKVDKSHPGNIHLNYQKKLHEFQERCKGLQINYINGSILHHYHGSIANRKYQERWSILTNNQYDPTIDISYNNNGIIHLSSQGKRFEEPILNYFKERLEDTTD
jgi:predicted DCC family thiol-disulfide oxidoreductase YuxK